MLRPRAVCQVEKKRSTFQLLHAISGPSIPQADRFVGAGRVNDITVSGKLQVHHGPGVSR